MSFDTDFDKNRTYTTFDTVNEPFLIEYSFLYKTTITRLVIKFRCILKRTKTNKTSN